MPLFLLCLAAILYSIGGLCMKYSEGLTRLWPSIGIFACFVSGAGCQALGMKQREMGSVYLLVLGLEAVVAVALGALILGERLTLGKVCAMALVVVGVALLERT